ESYVVSLLFFSFPKKYWRTEPPWATIPKTQEWVVVQTLSDSDHTGPLRILDKNYTKRTTRTSKSNGGNNNNNTLSHQLATTSPAATGNRQQHNIEIQHFIT